MSANTVTLTLKGTSDLKVMVTDLRNVATESQKAGTGLKTATTELDKGSKAATTFGQKMKNFGSTFSSSIASIGTLGGTVLNLSRQYQDLGDSQIAVDKAQLKVSKTTEAVGAAQGKLNALTAKGITSGAEYAQAQLDVKQALEAQSLAEQMLTERQEDHQRAQENFWIGLVPTITSAGASVISVVKEIGGTGGLGGLVSKFKGVGEAAKGLGLTMKTALIGTGIGAAIVALGLALEAFANNWWGVRDAVNDMGVALGNAIPALQPVLTALGKVGEGIVQTFGAGGTVPTAMVESSLAIQMYGETTTAALDKALKYTEFQKRLTEELRHFDDIMMASRNTEERNAAIASLEKLIAEGDKLVASETQQQSLARNGIKLYADSTGVKMKDAGATNSLSTATDGLGQSINTMNTSLNDTGGTFATITSNVGPATTGVAGLNAQMNPFNATLGATKTAVAAVNPELQFMATWLNQVTVAANAQGASAARAAQQTKQLSGVLAQATKNAQAYVRAVTPLQAGKSSKPQPQFGPTHPFLGRAANPNFQLKPNYQKAKIIKAQSGMHETVNSPTWILAGEAGRERVDIGKPGSSGGGFSGTINVYVDGVLRPARYDMGARK